MNLAEEEAKKPKKELTAEEKAEQLKRLEELRVKKAAERVEREKQVWHEQHFMMKRSLFY